MATLNGNNAYLAFNGVNVSAYYTDEISREANSEGVDITAGAGVTGIQRAAGLKDNSFTFVLVYDVGNVATYRSVLTPGTIATLTYGPESNTAGKPKFEGSMHLSSVSQVQSITKGKVAFECTFEQAAVPTATIEGGDVF